MRFCTKTRAELCQAMKKRCQAGRRASDREKGKAREKDNRDRGPRPPRRGPRAPETGRDRSGRPKRPSHPQTKRKWAAERERRADKRVQAAAKIVCAVGLRWSSESDRRLMQLEDAFARAKRQLHAARARARR